jgi:hypothetical protein
VNLLTIVEGLVIGAGIGIVGWACLRLAAFVWCALIGVPIDEDAGETPRAPDALGLGAGGGRDPRVLPHSDAAPRPVPRAAHGREPVRPFAIDAPALARDETIGVDQADERRRAWLRLMQRTARARLTRGF